MRKTPKFRMLAMVGCALALPALGRAATLRVPLEYGTIQAGIDAAVAGDTVLVAPGEYTEYVTRPVPGLGSITAMGFLKDAVVVLGESGAPATTLRHGPVANTVPVAFMAYGLASDETVVAGFSMVSGSPGAGVLSHVPSRLKVRDCAFRGLTHSAVNGFLSDYEVEDCLFEDCVGLGAVGQEEGLCRLTRCTFRRCRESAVFLNGYSGGPDDRAEIVDCVFEDCERTDNGGGGAIHIGGYPQGVIIDRCVFVGNRSAATGGAVTIGSSTLNPTLNPEIRNSVFWGNQSQVFGGSIKVNTPSQVIGNTFLATTVLDDFEGGGAAVYFSSGSQGTFRNNIVHSTSGGPAVATLIGTIASSCNVFWDTPDGIGFNYTMGPTDRVADPLFCDPSVGDLELSVGSPCLPENSAGCGLIGALGQGCGTVGLDATSFGKLKAAHRGPEENGP